MNIYELEKNVVPEPWEYGNEAVWSDCNGEGNSPSCVCEFVHELEGRLISHCRNNFTKALKALTNLCDNIGISYDNEHGSCPVCGTALYMQCDPSCEKRKALELLKELEEVK